MISDLVHSKTQKLHYVKSVILSAQLGIRRGQRLLEVWANSRFEGHALQIANNAVTWDASNWIQDGVLLEVWSILLGREGAQLRVPGMPGPVAETSERASSPIGFGHVWNSTSRVPQPTPEGRHAGHPSLPPGTVVRFSAPSWKTRLLMQQRRERWAAHVHCVHSALRTGCQRAWCRTWRVADKGKWCQAGRCRLPLGFALKGHAARDANASDPSSGSNHDASPDVADVKSTGARSTTMGWQRPLSMGRLWESAEMAEGRQPKHRPCAQHDKQPVGCTLSRGLGVFL